MISLSRRLRDYDSCATTHLSPKQWKKVREDTAQYPDALARAVGAEKR